MTDPKKFLRRKQAGEYLKTTYGAGSGQPLAKLASTGGGPIYSKLGAIALYSIDDLDAWARSRMVRRASSSALASDVGA